MIRINKYMMFAAMGLICSALIGCKTETEEIYVADIYQKAYLTDDIYPQNESVQCSIDESFTDTFLEVRNNRLVYSSGFLRTVTGSDSMSFFLRTLYAVNADVTASLVVVEDGVEAYNEANGLTDEEAYSLLPSEFYTMTCGTTTIKAGKKQGSEMFTVKINDSLEGLESGLYLIPLTIETDAAVPVSETMGTYYIPVKYSCGDFRTGESDVPSNLKLLAVNTDFTFEETTAPEALDPWGMGPDFAYASGFNSGMSSGQMSTALFDNNMSNYEMTAVANAEVTVTFNEPVVLDRIAFARYDNMASYTIMAYNPELKCLFEGETEFSESVSVSCPEADAPYIGWFDAASTWGVDKKIEKVVVKFPDDMTIFSDVNFVTQAE